MIKLFILLGLLFVPVADLSKVRNLYLEAVENEDKANELIRMTDPSRKDNPVMLGYNGAAKVLLAKFTFNPVSKMNHFNKGKKIVEDAISKAPAEPELRYLRLSIQENVPRMLGYSSMIATDRKFLSEKLPGIADPQLKKIISDYLNQSKK